ncbi:MAG: hypothetical protein U5L11_01005 [Arhodomonas sp.]|nr:hypothetical protein [Arhodomonas sp.]
MALALSVLASDLSVYGYETMGDAPRQVKAARLLLPLEEASEDGAPHCSLIGGDADRPLRNRLNAAALARACAEWLDNRAEVRTVSRPAPHNLYHIANGGMAPISPSTAAQPFTTVGLGRLPAAVIT